MRIEHFSDDQISVRRHYKDVLVSIDQCTDLVDQCKRERAYALSRHRYLLMRILVAIWYDYRIHMVRRTIWLLRRQQDVLWASLGGMETAVYELERREEAYTASATA